MFTQHTQEELRREEEALIRLRQEYEDDPEHFEKVEEEVLALRRRILQLYGVA
jgi:hypothetical protein